MSGGFIITALLMAFMIGGFIAAMAGLGTVILTAFVVALMLWWCSKEEV